MTPEKEKLLKEKYYNFEGLNPDAAKKWSKIIAKLPDAISGHQYALQIHKGTIDVCTEVRQAVNRYFRDIERAMGDNPPFYFEAKRVFVFFKFIREMKHVKGPLRGKKFEPEPWQCWMFLQIFGWHIEEAGTIKARFRRVYAEVPRGNGKSFMLSGVTLFGLSCDGEGGPEIVSAATSKDQAKIVWEDAKRFVVNDPEFLQETLGIVPRAFEILHPRSDGTFKPLANEGTNHDGLNPHIAAVDELHAHKDRSMYDVLETALGKRYRSLLFAI